MIELAKVVSKGIRFLRVDFYETNRYVYFGELTFYPNAGFIPFEENKHAEEIGNVLFL